MTRPRAQANPLVLLVDDDEDFRPAFATALRHDGLQVEEAHNGEAAFALLESMAKERQPSPDLIVLDLMMPRMNGLEALQRLRRHAQWKAIPVIVITGVNDPMLTIRLDVPVAYKADLEVLQRAVRQQLTAGSWTPTESSSSP